MHTAWQSCSTSKHSITSPCCSPFELDTLNDLQFKHGSPEHILNATISIAHTIMQLRNGGTFIPCRESLRACAADTTKLQLRLCLDVCPICVEPSRNPGRLATTLDPRSPNNACAHLVEAQHLVHRVQPLVVAAAGGVKVLDNARHVGEDGGVHHGAQHEAAVGEPLLGLRARHNVAVPAHHALVEWQRAADSQ